MSLIAYGTNVMNFYCGFFLTWKTCQAFKIGNVATRNDTLLIKWFLLYTFIQFEPLIQLFIELIPLGWLFPFLFKGYIIMPHTKWHSLIYDFFNKLEMDEQTNKFLLYLQHATKVAVIKVLGIVETYIDIIRVDELSDVEQKLNSISEKIITKKSSIEVRKSKLRVRNSVMDSEQQQYKSKIVPKHKTQALVLDNNVFIQYILQFNSKTCELLFMDIDTDEVIHRRSLKLIDLNEDRSLRMFYQEQEENLLIIKLSKGENVASWLEPVLESIFRKSTSTYSKNNGDNNREFYIAAIEQQMCVSICAYNEVTGEVYITQYLDCTTFSTTSSTILRFTPKVLISIQGNEKSVFFKQLEDDLEDTLIYFLPLSIVQCKADLSKFEKIVVKMQQLQNCFNCLMYTVQQHLSIQINKLPIQFYNLKEVMVFSKTTSQSLAIPELLKLFKPITNGGKRLLKANLLQPFSVAEQIEMRQKYTKHIQNLSESEISALKTYLNKFKSIDTLAQQQQQNTKRLIDQLQQIFRVYTYIKDLLNLNSFLKSIHLDGVMNMQLSKILESEEFNQIKYDIETQIDINLISHTNLDDEILYFILLNTDIQNDRQTMLDSKKEIQSLFQKYLSCFCIQMKCKKIKQNKYSIQCLRNGYVFEIAQQEAVRNNINEIDIKRIIEKEGDQVNFIDKNHQKINILTDKLAHLNLKLDTSINSIIKLTSDQINNLYQQLQLKCSWIFQVNQFISQLDVIQSFNQYVNTLNIYCYPQYNSQQFQIQEARYFKNNLETLSIKFNNFNVIYDHKEILSEQLKLVGQLIILSQIGCPVPCLQFNGVLVGQLYTHFQKYTIQNLAERQSSFTAEITSLNNILIGEHSDSLVLCDSLVLSSSHETNIALNLSFLEQLKQKVINGLFGSNEADTMQITELIQCNSMISRQEQICNIDQIELENILDNEFNADYKQNILQKLHNDLKFPQEFCQIMQRNFYVNSSV